MLIKLKQTAHNKNICSHYSFLHKNINTIYNDVIVVIQLIENITLKDSEKKNETKPYIKSYNLSFKYLFSSSNIFNLSSNLSCLDITSL